jgi:CheY-like chemotaxis protein
MKRILICDDEPHIVEGLRYLLRKPDREIAVAHNGKAAIELADKAIPDLLIIDIMMPVMNGLEAVAALRQDPKFAELPIIILTAKGCHDDSAVAEKLWQATVVAKPFYPTRLRELVNTILEKGPLPIT